ncbi:GlpM family protein [Candidatus Sodalis endolongispinus]|uniref:GlpM family protein n=1 Tax=Candidatus Sodalis endolongispinus TaxID=2812662 RepID=A0ABS5Y7V3_9GAMM|nr:GlpM family protein [Candidatus Sodalis endolongispinus]MBT9431082.1 GlpM family protein [Candidatus Sodalis endolongispinus]
MTLLFKALLGALVVVLIAPLAKNRNYYIAGLLPLFPTFALLAHYIVGTERGSEALRMTILFGIWAVIPYLVYLTSLYTFVGVMRLPLALSSAVVCWGIAAWLLIIAWRRWYGLT